MRLNVNENTLIVNLLKNSKIGLQNLGLKKLNSFHINHYNYLKVIMHR